MNITNDLSDDAALKELGRRLARCRLNGGLSQNTLAEEAGLSRNPVVRLEGGESIQLASFIRMLRMLRLLDNLDVVVPEDSERLADLYKRRGKPRQRAPRQKYPRLSSRPSFVREERVRLPWGDEK